MRHRARRPCRSEGRGAGESERRDRRRVSQLDGAGPGMHGAKIFDLATVVRYTNSTTEDWPAEGTIVLCFTVKHGGSMEAARTFVKGKKRKNVQRVWKKVFIPGLHAR